MAQIKKIAFFFLRKIATFLYVLSTRMLRASHSEWRCRGWSNRQLREWGALCKGAIINVSGWKDEDKEGGFYRDYFPEKTSYSISNIEGVCGLSGKKNEFYLNLENGLPEEYEQKFDVVFNHTVLEHVFDIRKAVANLCALSKDLVILVVPFIQPMHWEPGSFEDYWRPTPFALNNLLKENGFKIIHYRDNDNPVNNVYMFFVASCDPEKWQSKFNLTDVIDQKKPLGNCRYTFGMPTWLMKKKKVYKQCSNEL